MKIVDSKTQTDHSPIAEYKNRWTTTLPRIRGILGGERPFTPNTQYVDQTGDVGGPWYYEVAAWNDTCGAEGPY